MTIAESRGLPLVREMLLAHTYWRMRGFRADLVILDQETPSYDQPLRAQLERLIGRTPCRPEPIGRAASF